MLSQNLVPCVVMCSKEKKSLYVHGLNGGLIAEKECQTKGIIDVALGRNSSFRDVFAYIDEEECNLTMRSLPDLDMKIVPLRQRPTTFAIFENQKMIVLGDERGEFTLVWDPHCIPE